MGGALVRSEAMEGRQAELGTCMGKWSAGVLEYWRGAMRNVTDCYAKSPRRFTKVRTDQARKSAMLRIVTGETNFRREFRELARIIDGRDGRECRRIGLAWAAGRERVGPFTNRMAIRSNSLLNTTNVSQSQECP